VATARQVPFPSWSMSTELASVLTHATLAAVRRIPRCRRRGSAEAILRRFTRNNVQHSTYNRWTFTEEFKRNAVRLVTDEKNSFKAAAEALGEQSLRKWHARLAPSPSRGEHATAMAA
jgi:hypothetical protein